MSNPKPLQRILQGIFAFIMERAKSVELQRVQLGGETASPFLLNKDIVCIMIVRKRRISPNAKEVAVQVSYTHADLKAIYQKYFLKFEDAGGPTFAASLPMEERDLLHYFREGVFNHYPEHLAESLAKWAFVQGVGAGFLLRSELNKNTYFLAESLGKRPGRPRKLTE